MSKLIKVQVVREYQLEIPHRTMKTYEIYNPKENSLKNLVLDKLLSLHKNDQVVRVTVGHYDDNINLTTEFYEYNSLDELALFVRFGLHQ